MNLNKICIEDELTRTRVNIYNRNYRKSLKSKGYIAYTFTGPVDLIDELKKTRDEYRKKQSHD